MQQITAQGLDEVIQGYREQIELGKAIARLRENSDFKKVVLEGYLEEEAVRLVYARTDPSMAAPHQQADLVRQIDGVACFRDFFRTKLMLADQAANAIGEAEDLRTELLNEELS
jgi:hypothetical protein